VLLLECAEAGASVTFTLLVRDNNDDPVRPESCVPVSWSLPHAEATILQRQMGGTYCTQESGLAAANSRTRKRLARGHAQQRRMSQAACRSSIAGVRPSKQSCSARLSERSLWTNASGRSGVPIMMMPCWVLRQGPVAHPNGRFGARLQRGGGAGSSCLPSKSLDVGAPRPSSSCDSLPAPEPGPHLPTSVPAALQRGCSDGLGFSPLQLPGPLQPRCCHGPSTAQPTSMARLLTSVTFSPSTVSTARHIPVACLHGDVHRSGAAHPFSPS